MAGRANILDLPRDEFSYALAELEQQGVNVADLRNQYREHNSPMSSLFGAGRAAASDMQAQGRESMGGGILSFDPNTDRGFDRVKSIRPEFMQAIGNILGEGLAGITAPGEAARGEIPRDDMFGRAMGTAAMAMAGGGAYAARNGVDGSTLGSNGGNAGSTLTSNQSMAKRILDMRAAGRASEVTDDMMAQADPQYMFDNTPLPMGAASRDARAETAGFGGDLYHGGAGGYDVMNTEGRGKTAGTGAFMTPSRLLSETYAPYKAGSVYPLRSKSYAPEVGADMQNWNNIEGPVYAYDPKAPEGSRDIELIEEFERVSTDDIARAGRNSGLDALNISDVSDRGARSWGQADYPSHSTVRVEYNPANVRSQFARFDPEFSHLSNLSAANASTSAGLLAAALEGDLTPEDLGLLQRYIRSIQ